MTDLGIFKTDNIGVPKKGLGFVRAIYLPRIIGLGLLSLAIAAALHQRTAPTWLYVLDALFGLIWPHLAFLLSSNQKEPISAEYRNLRIDAVFCGFWAVAMGFNLLPTLLMVSVLFLDNSMVGGLDLAIQSFFLLLIGSGTAAVALIGIPFCFNSNNTVRYACIPFIIIYPVTIGIISYRNTQKITREKRTLRELNQRDSLSGLYSKFYWEQKLEEEFLRISRYQRPETLILMDIDNFKFINDNFGHTNGDKVLRYLGQVLIECLRAGDIPARLGGDEFGILLPETSIIEAIILIERIQEIISKKIFYLKTGQNFKVTLSFGLSDISQSIKNSAQWFEDADTALYRAKNAGRNTYKTSVE